MSANEFDLLQEYTQRLQLAAFRAIIKSGSFDPEECHRIKELEELLPQAHKLDGQLELF